MPEHAKRIKIRRKALRQPDEFHTLTAQAVAWFEAHRVLVLGAAAAAGVIAAAAIGLARYDASRNEAAGVEFRRAHETFDAGRFKDAAEAFAALGSAYPRTAFGRLAPLYRAHALARQGDAGAGTAYEEYLAGSPPTPYLRQEALDGLAHAKEAAADPAGALDAYTQAGALAGPFKTDALLGAARLQEAAGRPDAAREIYARLQQDAADPDLKALLAAKLPVATATAVDPGGSAAGPR